MLARQPDQTNSAGWPAMTLILQLVTASKEPFPTQSPFSPGAAMPLPSGRTAGCTLVAPTKRSSGLLSPGGRHGFYSQLLRRLQLTDLEPSARKRTAHAPGPVRSGGRQRVARERSTRPRGRRSTACRARVDRPGKTVGGAGTRPPPHRWGRRIALEQLCAPAALLSSSLPARLGVPAPQFAVAEHATVADHRLSPTRRPDAEE